MQNREIRSVGQVALVAGASGLVGREIVRQLSMDESIAEVRALIRRPLPPAERRPRIRPWIVDFDHLEKTPEAFDGLDLVFSALGTTIRTAGSRNRFRQVDFEYPLAIARAAHAAGARHFLLVSALGANSRSCFFYNRVKGELEEAIAALGYPSVTVARPSLLLGYRSERRFGEQLAKRFAWLLPSPWAGVHASQVALALVQAARAGRPGVEILENKRMRMGGIKKS